MKALLSSSYKHLKNKLLVFDYVQNQNPFGWQIRE